MSAMRTVNKMSDRLYVGIDLGTYQSTISSSAGVSHTIETVVGRPKDPVARNFLGRDVLFGNDALKNKLACNLYRPMAAGVAQDDEATWQQPRPSFPTSSRPLTLKSSTKC